MDTNNIKTRDVIRVFIVVAAVVLAGLALPFVARFSRGPEFLNQYTSGGLSDVVFIEVFNLLAVISAAATVVFIRRRMLWLLPVLSGYGYLWYCHSTLDLASDPQSGFSLAFIPITALPVFAVGGFIAGVVLWLWKPRSPE